MQPVSMKASCCDKIVFSSQSGIGWATAGEQLKWGLWVLNCLASAVPAWKRSSASFQSPPTPKLSGYNDTITDSVVQNGLHTVSCFWLAGHILLIAGPFVCQGNEKTYASQNWTSAPQFPECHSLSLQPDSKDKSQASVACRTKGQWVRVQVIQSSTYWGKVRNTSSLHCSPRHLTRWIVHANKHLSKGNSL